MVHALQEQNTLRVVQRWGGWHRPDGPNSLLMASNSSVRKEPRSATMDEGREVWGERRGKWSSAVKSQNTNGKGIENCQQHSGRPSSSGSWSELSQAVGWGVFFSGWLCGPGWTCADGELDLSREADKGKGGGPQGQQGWSVPCRTVEGGGINRPEATPGTKSAYSWHIRESKQETGEAEEWIAYTCHHGEGAVIHNNK